MPDLPRARIVERRDVTPDLWVIRLEPETEFRFQAGQYMTIGLNGLERAYSIVSAPHEPQIELFIELVPPPAGNLTPVLHKLAVGESVTMRPRAKGIFTMDDRYPDQVMVATVTGVVPYVSILRDYLYRGRSGHRFFILQGASYQDEFAYDRELAGLAAAHPDFIAYVPTVSRPQEARNATWGGEKGRVNTIVEKYLRRFGTTRKSTLVYACGHPGMIEDLKARLLPKGWRVKEERFWKE
ncbi:MAG: ferredoxin--NADP reductase [Chloroflexi bacterium]|nr:ferredoxin--NADP reductase [Chloroflexota bacterium]